MRPLKTLKRLYDDERQVVITEKGSPPRVLFFGEDFLLEDLPVGTRVIFPRSPLEGVPNVKAAIRWALNHPEGMEPLHALLRPGMKVTIAIDDISLPLPPMKLPDVRQTILEIVLELLADSGRRRRPPHHRQRAPPPDDRGGDEADGGGEDLRRLLPRALLQPRRRGPRGDGGAGAHRARRGGGHQPPRRGERPPHLREHQPGPDGRRPQVGGHRAGQLRVAPGAPQPQDHPRVARATWSRRRARSTRAPSASAG